MEHPLLGGDGSGSLFPSSSVAILELDHRLPPSTPVQPMSLFGDDDGVAVDEDGASREFLSPEGGGDHASKGCSFLWQRMKWTDDVVRLLISVVASVGDDTYAIDSVVNASSVVELSRKANAALQKKGKWKMVSKLMMQNRCYVSPQQCEDKFNDLNKRYKRLNEILGRGTCCQVVENPALLDSMSHISQKVKDDVRRILSSKHLFYREMCAYHNGQRVPDSFCVDVHPSDVSKEVLSKDEVTNEFEDEEAEDDGQNEGDGVRSDDLDRLCYDKLRCQIDLVLQDTTKTLAERKLWIQERFLQLLVERLAIQSESYELEKRWLKWKRFCSKKDRELDSLRMENERIKLENERMAIQLRHKELELKLH